MINPFSFFGRGYVNCHGRNAMTNKPDGTMDIPAAYDYITGGTAKSDTEQFQLIEDHKEAQAYKLLHFEYCTFAGQFTYRNANGLIKATGLMVLDVDDLKDNAEVLRVRDIFIHDTRVESALVFTSPSGLGVKSVVVLDDRYGETFKEKFNWLSMYFAFEYGIKIDKSGSDICRACYLPYDPICYINPKYKK